LKGMKTLCSALFFFLVLLSPHQAPLEKTASDGAEAKHIEKYHYEAVLIGKEDETEQIRLDHSFDEQSIRFASRAVSEKAEERISVKMFPEGHCRSLMLIGFLKIGRASCRERV
jgi:hypothetical protein